MRLIFQVRVVSTTQCEREAYNASGIYDSMTVACCARYVPYKSCLYLVILPALTSHGIDEPQPDEKRANAKKNVNFIHIHIIYSLHEDTASTRAGSTRTAIPGTLSIQRSNQAICYILLRKNPHSVIS